MNTFLKKIGSVVLSATLLAGCSLFGGQPTGTGTESGTKDVLREMQSKIQQREMKSGNVTGKLTVAFKGTETGNFTLDVNSDFDVQTKGAEKLTLTLGLAGESTSGKGNVNLDLLLLAKTLYAKLGAINISSEKDPSIQQMVDLYAKQYIGQWIKMDLPEGANPFEMTGEKNFNDEQEAQLKELVKKSDFFKVTKDFGNEKVSNTDCYHYGIELDVDGIATFMKQAGDIVKRPVADTDIQEFKTNFNKYATIAGELWIGTADKFIYQAKLNITAKEKEGTNEFNVGGKLTLDPTKSVSVTAPADAKDIKEILAPLMRAPTTGIPPTGTDLNGVPSLDNRNGDLPTDTTGQ